MSWKTKLYHYATLVPGVRPLVDSIRDRVTYRRFERRGSFAQHGEDHFLLNYFGNKTQGSYLDIGASHPFRISNTYLLYKHGWRGTIVEPIQELCKLHQRWRPLDKQLNVAVAATPGEQMFYELVPTVLSTFDEASAQATIAAGNRLRSKRLIPTVTLQKLIEDNPQPFDVLSIDAEGYDHVILSSYDWTVRRPTLVIFERNDESDMQTNQLLESKNYRLVTSMGCNRIYENQESQTR
jgi:FkbM family methyltransferase